MYKRFCVNCGKETNELINGLCKECYFKLKKKEDPTILEINFSLCSICGKIKYKNKWIDLSTFIQKIKKEYDLRVNSEPYLTKKYIILGNIKIKIPKKEVCPQCSRMLSKSYSYIIQLRNVEINEFLELIKDEMVKSLEETSNGYNLYLDMKKSKLRKILYWAKRKKYDIKITKKLITLDKRTSKPRYRVTIRIKK